jgi:hypothetical protein
MRAINLQPSQLQQIANQTSAQGQQMYNSDINNANQYQGQYSGYQNQANAANQNLQSYTNYMQNAGNPLNLYNQQLQGAFQSQGFNPQTLSTATQNLTQSQNALQNLYQAQQTGTGGYGLTGGQLGNYYSTLTNPLTQQIGAQNNAVGNLQQLYQNALGQAQTGAQLGFQGEQQTSQNLGQIFTNAQTQASQALSQMQFYSQLASTQGNLNAQQAQGYTQALGAYQQAIASANQANATAQQIQQQITMMNQAAAQQQNGNPNTGLGVLAPGRTGLTDKNGNVIGVAPQAQSSQPQGMSLNANTPLLGGLRNVLGGAAYNFNQNYLQPSLNHNVGLQGVFGGNR